MDNQAQDVTQEVGEKETANRSLNLVTVELVVAEYNTLRDEILRASDRKMQLATIATIAIGTLFATGIQFGSADLILVFPILGAAVAALWAAEDRTIQTIGAYIQKTIEEERAGIDNLSWEHFVAKHPWVFRINYWIGARLFFLGTSVAAIILGASISKDSKIAQGFERGAYTLQIGSSEDVLLLIAGISTIITLIIMFTLVGRSWREKIVKPNAKKGSVR